MLVSRNIIHRDVPPSNILFGEDDVEDGFFFEVMVGYGARARLVRSFASSYNYDDSRRVLRCPKEPYRYIK